MESHLNIRLGREERANIKDDKLVVRSLLKKLKDWSELNNSIEKYGFSINQLLDLYSWESDMTNVSDFQHKYWAFLENFSFRTHWYHWGEVVELSDILKEPVDNIWSVDIELKAFLNKIHSVLNKKEREEIPFSPNFINLTSCEKFKISLQILPLHMIPDFFRYFKENKNRRARQSSQLKDFISKYSNNCSVWSWCNCIDNQGDAIFNFLRGKRTNFKPIFLPNWHENMNRAKKISLDLLDSSSEQHFISSLVLLDYQLWSTFLQFLQKEIKKWWREYMDAFRWESKIRAMISKNINGFHKREWRNFATNWWPAIYNYLYTEKKYEK